MSQRTRKTSDSALGYRADAADADRIRWVVSRPVRHQGLARYLHQRRGAYLALCRPPQERAVRRAMA